METANTAKEVIILFLMEKKLVSFCLCETVCIIIFPCKVFKDVLFFQRSVGILHKAIQCSLNIIPRGDFF